MTGRLFEFKDTFTEISKKMKKEMKDFDLNEKKEFNVRDCCAVFNDGQWKRGMVECVNSQNYQVYLVDFGKSDIIPENHIKPLPDSVIQFPMLAYRLQLRSIPIGALVTSEQRRKVTEILTSQPIELFNIEYESTIFQVMIQDHEIERQLDQLLMSESNLADQSLNDSAFGSQDRSRSFPVSHELEIEQKYKVKIETIIDTNHAYISLVDRKEDFSVFQSRLNEYCNKQNQIISFENASKTIFGFKMPLGSWARARMSEKLTNEDAEMELIDQSFVTRRCHLDQLVEIEDPEFYEFPVRSIKCRVLNKSSLVEIKQLAKSETIYADFNRESASDDVMTVNFYNQNEELIKRRSIIDDYVSIGPGGDSFKSSDDDYNAMGASSKYSSLPVLPGAVYDVVPLKFDSINSFIFAQRTKLNSIYSYSLGQELTAYYGNQEKEGETCEVTLPLTKGDAVAVCSRKTWCRAEVVAVRGEQARVYLVDIGQFTMVPIDQIYKLPHVFITRQASPIIRCSLCGLIEPEAEEKAFELLQSFCLANTTLSVSIIGKVPTYILKRHQFFFEYKLNSIKQPLNHLVWNIIW